MRLLTNFIFFLIAFSALTGCQQAAEEIILPPAGQAFTVDSNAAALINHTTLRDGSYDNILDGSSCISLVLPVTIVVNGLELTVSSESDFKYVERILDESDSDDDAVNISFPITIILSDYSQTILQNEDALEAIREQCIEGGGDDDIECIDFKYPLKVSVYDTKTQISNVITLNDDKALFTFINILKGSELVSFPFPIVMLQYDGTEITIQDNEALEDVLSSAVNDCDEDDDNDFNDDDIDNTELNDILINGTWKVSYFFDEGDETSEFTNFTFSFNADGTAVATDGNILIEGTWESNGDDGKLELIFDFGEISPFNKVGEDWEVGEFNDLQITLVDEHQVDNEPVKTLIFGKL